MNKVSVENKSAVEDFLYREAECMDGHRYDEWLSLWAEDLKYWVPCNEDSYDPTHHVSLIYDDRTRLKERIFRLKSKFMHAQMPSSRLSRVVSNIRIKPTADAKIIEVNSTFSLAEARMDLFSMWVGRQTHVLEVQGDEFRIREKRVYLVNNDGVMQNLTFLI